MDHLGGDDQTNAQAFNIYNTYTDASNYERVTAAWNANVFVFGPEHAGTGSARGMTLSAAGRLAQIGLGTTYNEIVLTAGTVRLGNDLLMNMSAGANINFNGGVGNYGNIGRGPSGDFAMTFAPGSNLNYKVAIQNAANPMQLQIYNTITDASNYEQVFLKWNANFFDIGAEAAGTGTSRSIRLLANGNEHIRLSGNAVSVKRPLVQDSTSQGYTQIVEQSNPPNGIANFATVYAEDDGSGKTRLMVQFGTGFP